MKLIGFWLLCLVAVLVPVTAGVAASMMCPEAIVAKAQPSHASTADVHRSAASVTSRMHGAQKQKALSSSTRKVASSAAMTGKDSTEPCCDAKPCSHCITCGAGASMMAAGPSTPQLPETTSTLVAGPAAPRAEFQLSGQDRPPRRA